ncbi:MAG TPA: TraR/DksA C4-type zinc finger protein [Kofleriaceae bacterium]|jgi:RNA polymerase-binding transcription factor DksA
MLSKTEAIHARLIQRRRALLTRYRDELARVEEELAQRDAESVEASAEEWDARVLSSLGDADMRSIVAVTEAIRRLEGGSYGTCTSCEQPIASARLEAVPETLVCVTCAEQSEHPHRRAG